MKLIEFSLITLCRGVCDPQQGMYHYVMFIKEKTKQCGILTLNPRNLPSVDKIMRPLLRH